MPTTKASSFAPGLLSPAMNGNRAMIRGESGTSVTRSRHQCSLSSGRGMGRMPTVASPLPTASMTARDDTWRVIGVNEPY